MLSPLAGRLRHPRRARPPVHLTPHQWRHTLGTRLINRDVPQHVVQKILDHDSPAMTAHYARLSDKTVRDHWEGPQGQRRGTARPAQPRRAARRRRLGQAAAVPRHPGAAQRLLPAAPGQDLPAREQLPDLPDVRDYTRTSSRSTAQRQADPADHHRRRGQRPVPRRRDEPAGRRQPRQDHHRPRRRRQAGKGQPPVRPDPLSEAAARRHELTRSRAIQALRELDRRPARDVRRRRIGSRDLTVVALHPARHPQPDPAGSRGTGSRRRRRSRSASGRPTRRCAPGSPPRSNATKQLAEENARLRRQLARALGDQRSAGPDQVTIRRSETPRHACARPVGTLSTTGNRRSQPR
jgi:hypothetical protein